MVTGEGYEEEQGLKNADLGSKRVWGKSRLSWRARLVIRVEHSERADSRFNMKDPFANANISKDLITAGAHRSCAQLCDLLLGSIPSLVFQPLH
jgi:hypothetical protein